MRLKAVDSSLPALTAALRVRGSLRGISFSRGEMFESFGGKTALDCRLPSGDEDLVPSGQR